MIRLLHALRDPRRRFTRRSSFRLPARLVAVLLPLSLLAPTLLCGVQAISPRDASACCRAMKFACHRGDTYSACCERQAPEPSRLAIIAPVRKSTHSQPMLAVSLLPIAAMNATPSGWQRAPSASDTGHAPPGEVPLFLLHSILLI
ncbi:MAG TPA: hypothetical protein VJV74_14320 [Terriglobia bacterium]|nr:hypothetical protein [Terriglobia bacterium]